MFIWTFLLRMTHTIISQSIADSSWITLCVCVCVCVLSSWKIVSLLGNNIWTSGNKSSRWIMSSAVTFAAVVLWFSNTILFIVLSRSFGFQPLFLLADDVFPWFLCAIITLETVALIHLIKWLFWLQMLQLNAHQQSVLFENLTSFPFLQHFHMNCY